MIDATGRTRSTWRVLAGTTSMPGRRGRAGFAPVTRWAAATPLVPPTGAAGRLGHVHLGCGSISWLRRLLAEPAGAARARRVTLRVGDWRPPRAGWSGRLGPLPGLRRHRVSLPRSGGTAVIEVRLADAVPLREVLSAALAVLAPVRPLPAAARPDAVGLRVVDRTPAVRFDTAVANPIGRPRPYGRALRPGRLRPAAGAGPAWQLTVPGAGPGGAEQVLSAGALDGTPLTVEQLLPLRTVATVQCRGLPAAAPAAVATLLTQLAATGAVLAVPELPPAVGDRLATPLRALVGAPLPRPGADPLELELRSVRQRRAALRGHGAPFAPPRATAGGVPGSAAPPPVSAILVTRRPQHIAEAVRRIAAQTYPELEIVLCPHGMELDARLRARLAGCGRPLTIVEAPGACSFGEAMAAATARARGSLITKVDDDDGYGPEHVWDLVLAREYSGATLVGKAAEFVHLQPLGVTVRRLASGPETYGPPVAGGTMLIGRGDLEGVGGWRPVPRSVDRGLMDRVSRSGGLVYRTHPLGYLYERRADGHTWDAGLDYFLWRSGQQWDGYPPYAEFGVGSASG
ncbi:Glycosyltransferase involved in cell wall bisynthesis [Micromonospora pattaloongensis]|uniref:Glycosyltransferase involved in cell wall bisynthesis n=1 Tax=Micromonospora pattaloongensis TaxID=405436 RepID=A0A1H3SKL3_9ACTN|nr:glycosyltransferase [Micromonospora pattaloongensis]SDZ38277.1 Glycosyltransferase involved in cell wall bisynthesis [Micromonospora pattaloongensis]